MQGMDKETDEGKKMKREIRDAEDETKGAV